MNFKSPHPPRLPDRFLQWFCADEVLETLQGDLYELYEKRREGRGKLLADVLYWADVASACRPFAFRRKRIRSNSNYTTMFQHYFKVSWRALLKQKAHLVINAGGLAAGMAVTLLIGLWIYDELSFNRYYPNHDRIALVYQHKEINDEIVTSPAGSMPLREELELTYRSDFEHIVAAWWTREYILSIGDQEILQTGNFMEPDVLEMFGFEMLQGNWESLDDPASIVLSQSAARALFGTENPMGQMLEIDNTMTVKVTGVFKDPPANARFHNLRFISTWDLWVASNPWMKADQYNWESEGELFVALAPGVSFAEVSAKIAGVKQQRINSATAQQEKPTLFLYQMAQWHLYSEWKNGVAGGRIQFVWLFGIIGAFVLLLACINFVNLSTSQAARRAKEVGIRKAIGSSRTSLIFQLLTQSFMVVMLAFAVAIAAAALALPWFNALADKGMAMPWTQPYFWLAGLLFVCLTGLLAGTYPAFYLSAMQPVKVLKGTFKAGPLASIQRKVLTVFQFAISIALIIGTLVVWQQIQHAKNRPIGYSREGLISIRKMSPAYWGKFQTLKNELLASGAVTSVAESSGPATESWFHSSDITWKGKDPNQQADFTSMAVTHDYGKTVGWKFLKGRDFSRDFSSDSTAIILNESAARLISLIDPVAEQIMWNDRRYTVIGVIEDMVMDSPYEPVKPALFWLNGQGNVWINIRINPQMSASDALVRIEHVFSEVIPGAPFNYQFVDESFAVKFAAEERIGTLATFFAALSIVISCLGLYAMAAFMAEQRTKEIGIRKVLGASAFNLWGMLSRDFVVLVIIACLIAMPLAGYWLNRWLDAYAYRIAIGWHLFALTAIGTLVLTLCTVSWQALKTATANPVKSLRTE